MCNVEKDTKKKTLTQLKQVRQMRIRHFSLISMTSIETNSGHVETMDKQVEFRLTNGYPIPGLYI